MTEETKEPYMCRAVYKAQLYKEAWEHWEEDNKSIPVNPYAYVMGYMAAKLLPVNHPETFDENGLVKPEYRP